jgi:hypothetical protein
MAVNIKANYKNIPHQTIGPFTATLEHYESSGITFDAGSVSQLLSTTGGTSTGIVEVLNVGPQYTILNSNLTHQQLVNGYKFYQIKCGDSYITFQSTDVCYSSYVADIIGANGYPSLGLTLTNDTGVSLSSTLTVTPTNGALPPEPSTITLSSSTIGEEKYDEIALGKGTYEFEFDITTGGSGNVQIEFINCGSA